MKNKMLEEFKLTVTNVVENKDGSAVLILNLSDEFKKSFMASQNLKRWSSKRFKDFIIVGLKKSIHELEKLKEIRKSLKEESQDVGEIVKSGTPNISLDEGI